MTAAIIKAFRPIGGIHGKSRVPALLRFARAPITQRDPPIDPKDVKAQEDE